MFPKVKKPKKIIYLDHAAATPLDREVKKAMEPFLGEKFGNPSSLYGKGREAKKAVDAARNAIAGLISARPSEIIFTAGGSESVNLAVQGTARIHTNLKTDKHGSPHLITSTIEHHCVINSFKALAEEGSKTSFVGVDKFGVIDIDKLKKAIRPETVLISVMMANNEIGTIQPIAEIGRWLKGENQRRIQKHQQPILFHTDACQAAGFLDLNVNKPGVDLMSVNGSKIYGPKQTGFLYVRSGINLKPLIYGGGQENGLRGGTENVVGVVGLAKAFELVNQRREKENNRLIGLRNYLVKELFKRIPKMLLNGAGNSKLNVNHHQDKKINRLPNNINLTILGVEGEALMLYLDAYGICVSTSSACSTGTTEASHVLLALGRSEVEAKSSIRLTLGKQNTKAEINYVIKILPDIVKELRKIKKNN